MPRWKEEKPGRPIVAPADPWQGREAEAVDVGKRIYHLTGVQNDEQASALLSLATPAVDPPRDGRQP